MIKIIDIDSLFDKYISGYVYKNIGKVKPEEIEDKMPVLYKEFGSKPLDVLDGKSPETYYASFSAKELLECLKGHIEKGVSVSDFLCEAIRDGDTEDEIVKELQKDNGEEYTLYLMNILNDKNSNKCADRYLEFILWDYTESVREFATELLCGYADKVKEKILTQYKEVCEEKKGNLTEILSHASKDDRIFDILIEQFVKHPKEISLYCSYIARYGDERALPFLLAKIEEEGINYSDFEELRFTIEALGGEYDKERDFSKDAVKKKITGASNTHII